MLKSLQRLVYFPFRHQFIICPGSCDCVGWGAGELAIFLWMKHLTLTNTKRRFWSMWRTDTVAKIDFSPSINPNAYCATISPLPQLLLDLVNFLWSIWYVQRWWRLQNAGKCGSNDAWTKRLRSTLTDSCKALCRMTAWFNSELGEMNPDVNDYHSSRTDICSTFWIQDITYR